MKKIEEIDRNFAKKEAREQSGATYDCAVANGDGHVAFIDGSTFYPAEAHERCSMDGCHPNDLGFFYMAQKIGSVIEPLL